MTVHDKSTVRIEEGTLVVGRFFARPFFRWYDLWIGAYWSRNQCILYVCPLPMLGVYFGRAQQEDDGASDEPSSLLDEGIAPLSEETRDLTALAPWEYNSACLGEAEKQRRAKRTECT